MLFAGNRGVVFRRPYLSPKRPDRAPYKKVRIMLEIRQTAQGERGLIISPTGFARAVRLGDTLAARFVGAEVLYRLPVVARGAGFFGCVTLTVEALGCIYPDWHSRGLRVVDSEGGLLLGVGSTLDLASKFRTSRASVMECLFLVKQFPPIRGSYVVSSI